MLDNEMLLYVCVGFILIAILAIFLKIFFKTLKFALFLLMAIIIGVVYVAKNLSF